MTTLREHALALLLGVGLAFIIVSTYAQWLLDALTTALGHLPR